MLRAVGMGDDDFAKPQIGVASVLERDHAVQPLDRLAKASKEGVFEAGGYPLEFGTISVSDGISMGHEGMHFLPGVTRDHRRQCGDRHAGRAPRRHGHAGWCDKSLPGMMMARAPGSGGGVPLRGSILPGFAKMSDGSEREVTIIDAFEWPSARVRAV